MTCVVHIHDSISSDVQRAVARFSLLAACCVRYSRDVAQNVMRNIPRFYIVFLGDSLGGGAALERMHKVIDAVLRSRQRSPPTPLFPDILDTGALATARRQREVVPAARTMLHTCLR